MNDCDALLREVMAQAGALGIPISQNIAPHVRINRRAAMRFGCCRYEGGRQVIEVALRVAQGPERSCRETLAHEVLHTCWGCRDHGKRWKEYAQRMNETYGYHISRTSTDEEMGVAEERSYKYILRCRKCGAEFRRLRASNLTKYPERYRCRCGGKLELEKGRQPLGQNGLQV